MPHLPVLRILERSGAIAQTALTKIYRQQIPGLREPVEDLSKGWAGDGFRQAGQVRGHSRIADDDARLATISEKQLRP
jgi:hypothetical protein